MTQYATYPSLKGKSIFVTGGGSGIGAAIVKAFCQQQAKVAFIDINKEVSQKLIVAIEQLGLGKPWFAPCDVCDIEQLEQAIEQASKAQGPISALINNVGNDTRQKVENTTLDDWQSCMEINLRPAFFSAKKIFPMMKQTGSGSIVNISSINALWGPDNMSGYVTAKAGLLGMSKSLAREFGNDNIRVNTVLPGWVKTEKQLKLWLTPEAEKQWLDQLCIKKLLCPEDIARLVLFLSADDSALITSQHYIIDCGRI